MALKDDLQPTGRNRVIDLVRAAGIDVSDWGNFKRGKKWAAANPKYCYEWAFTDPSGIVVLNLWYSNLEESRGRVLTRINMRKVSEDMARRGSKPVWIKRAAAMDGAIQFAVTKKARIRVLVNEGEMRKANDPKQKASTVHARLLDPLPWRIQSYDATTGAAVLVRGVDQAPKVDQFDVPELGSSSPDIVETHGTAFVRDPAVRRAVLERASGRCEYCSSPGFVTSAGAVFLETHHIVPLSEGGADKVSNVAAVCPNHHREAHYGAGASVIRDVLLGVAAGK